MRFFFSKRGEEGGGVDPAEGLVKDPAEARAESAAENSSAERVIAQHNDRMLGVDMVRLLMTESIGGNAGSQTINGKKYPCAAANGYADRDTGKIVAFGNSQNIDPEITANNEWLTLLVAVDFRRFTSSGSVVPPPRQGFFRIVHFKGAEDFSEAGRQAIQQAIDRYNSAYAG